MKPDDETSSRLRAIAAQIARHAPTEGITPTVVPGLALFRSESTALIQRGILKPSFCMVAQGEKLAHAGADTTLRYGAGKFITSSIDIPIVGQVIAGSRAKPYLSATFELSPHDVLDVVDAAKISVAEAATSTPATFVGACDAKILDVVLRFVKSLDDEREARFFAPLLRRELVYRLVTGPHAFAICQSASMAGSDDGVGRAIAWLRTHFKEALSISELAKRAKMSTSSLQHRFKATVLMAPLQYQKRLRLEEARRLLLSGLADATTAAFDVGYESPSQFTREYRRQFGLPPLRDVKRMRTEARSEDRASRAALP